MTLCQTCLSFGVVMANPEDLYYSAELEAYTVDGEVKTKPCSDCTPADHTEDT